MDDIQEDVRPLVYEYLGDLYSLLGEENKTVIQRTLKARDKKLAKNFERKGDLLKTIIASKDIYQLLRQTRRIDPKKAQEIEEEIAKKNDLRTKIQEYKETNDREIAEEINDIIISNDLLSFSDYLTRDSGVSPEAVHSKEMFQQIVDLISFSPMDLTSLYLKYADYQMLDKFLDDINKSDEKSEFEDGFFGPKLENKKSVRNFIRMSQFEEKGKELILRSVLRNKRPDLIIYLLKKLDFEEGEIDLLSEPTTLHPKVLEYLLDHNLIASNDSPHTISLTSLPSKRLQEKIADAGLYGLIQI